MRVYDVGEGENISIGEKSNPPSLTESLVSRSNYTSLNLSSVVSFDNTCLSVRSSKTYLKRSLFLWQAITSAWKGLCVFADSFGIGTWLFYVVRWYLKMVFQDYLVCELKQPCSWHREWIDWRRMFNLSSFFINKAKSKEKSEDGL